MKFIFWFKNRVGRISAVPSGLHLFIRLPGSELPGYYQVVPPEGVTNRKVSTLDFVGENGGGRFYQWKSKDVWRGCNSPRSSWFLGCARMAKILSSTALSASKQRVQQRCRLL